MEPKFYSEKDFHDDFFQDFALIGEGTYGVVYRMKVKKQQEFKEEQYAVKIMESNSGKSHEQIKKELQILFGLPQHKNIIKLIKAYTWIKQDPVESNVFCLVMELADRNLQQEIDIRKHSSQQFTEQELLDIFTQCFEVFNTLIKKQIYHRDIKPENILFQRKGNLNIKITDFGVSKQFQDQMSMQKGTLVGTPAYLSPALWKSFRNGEFNLENIGKISHNLEKSDVYSLGITLIQATLLLKNEVIGMNKNEAGIKKTETILKNVKSDKIREILSKMLDHDEIKRPNFQDLLQLVNRNSPKILTLIKQNSISSPQSSLSSSRNRSNDRQKIFDNSLFSPQLTRQKSSNNRLNQSNADSTLTPPKQEYCRRHNYQATYYLINDPSNKNQCDKCYQTLNQDQLQFTIHIKEYKERTESTVFSEKLQSKIDDNRKFFLGLFQELNERANLELKKIKEFVISEITKIIDKEKDKIIIQINEKKEQLIIDKLNQLYVQVNDQIIRIKDSQNNVLSVFDPAKLITDQNQIEKDIIKINKEIQNFNQKRDKIIYEGNMELINNLHNSFLSEIEKLKNQFSNKPPESYLDLSKYQNIIQSQQWKIQGKES